MAIKQQMQNIRLIMLVMLLLQHDDFNNLSKKDVRKYEKYYLEITGETWKDSKHLYQEEKCPTQPAKNS